MTPDANKNETTRFLGDGVSFKAKLIGILEVSEARGDRMCQEALSDLKMAIRAAGEHKQRITINIAIDGLRLRDEKTGDSLYHHPVHKISFIAQDMTDSRAFGYIFGSPDTGHRFFGIKTDKAASQVVIAMRDLFQVVFAIKKKEIELAKQHLDKGGRYSSSPLFSETSLSVKEAHHKSSSNTDSKSASTGDKSTSQQSGTAVADLVDLELELNSLQQGLNQMERITPSQDPFGSKDDPFGDSFTAYGVKPILPPPPSSGRERASRTSETSSIFSPRTPHTLGLDSCSTSGRHKEFNFSRSDDGNSSGDWFTPSNNSSIFEEPTLVPEPPSRTHDKQPELVKQEIMALFDVFTELDPLELKNPPKKALNDLASRTNASASTTHHRQDIQSQRPALPTASNDPFGEDPFVTEDPFANMSKHDPFESDFGFKLKTVVTPNDSCQKSKSPNLSRLHQFHDTYATISGDSECAPEPPPRPAPSLMQIKPPPLPPKKQTNDLATKPPPPRPPHTDDSAHFDHVDCYESSGGGNVTSSQPTPPLPVPSRKTKFEGDFVAPERPRKQTNSSEEGDYLTPVSGGLLPPPKRKPVTAVNIDSLDITLSQLTLSGLNELAVKLNIPTNQLSNMTLVQLTSYLSNFIKSNGSTVENNRNAVEDDFKPDFAANFNNVNRTTETYDRYAVFRELMNEEIKQTRIDTEPEEIQEEQQQKQQRVASPVEEYNRNNEMTSEDRYAALREIVEAEIKTAASQDDENQNEESATDEQEVALIKTNLENRLKTDGKASSEATSPHKYNLIEYNNTTDKERQTSVTTPTPKSPKNTPTPVKSPVPSSITEIQNSARLTSGSLSDVISGSSPEIDASNSEVTTTTGGPKNADAAAESWAIFDQDADAGHDSSAREKLQPSEEGVSPWSSDSKEFGNGSPPEWRGRSGGGADSSSDHRPKRRGAARRGDQQEGWWDTAAEPPAQYYGGGGGNRRSATDSYEEEYYECYERPRRRKYVHASPATGGHSSSSRDISPWEEEPRRRPGWPRHPRQHSFEKHKENRRHADSWDEEDDDYDYGRFHRHGNAMERPSRHAAPDWSSVDEYAPSKERRHRPRRLRTDDNNWCCADRHDATESYTKRNYDANPPPPPPPTSMWRERTKHNPHDYYMQGSRDSQESPSWEEEDYTITPAEQPEPPPPMPPLPPAHFAKKNWKRPSSASEMDRKTGELKSRHYLQPGGSDGERERRYKSTRRSRSRDSSQYSDVPVQQQRSQHGARAKGYGKVAPSYDQDVEPARMDMVKPKSASLRKKKVSPKSDEHNVMMTATFPRKNAKKQSSMFENDFVGGTKANFENEFETSDVESPTVNFKPKRNVEELMRQPKSRLAKPKSLFEDDFSPGDNAKHPPQAAPCAPPTEEVSIMSSSIKEEIDAEEDAFDTDLMESTTNNARKSKLNKRLNCLQHAADGHLKKSESVNIFARESDPFDDDFFSEEAAALETIMSPRTTDLKWTDDFEEYANKK